MQTTNRAVARAETVGSLLQPDALLEARAQHQKGEIDVDTLHGIEDEAVLDAIRLQESLGLDVISDGEMRRSGWSAARTYLDGLEPRQGPRSYPTNVRAESQSDPSATFPTVVRKVSPRTDATLAEEYPYLGAHATQRTKYTMAAPSYFRRFWSDRYSVDAYGSCEEFLTDVRDWMHDVSARARRARAVTTSNSTRRTTARSATRGIVHSTPSKDTTSTHSWSSMHSSTARCSKAST